MLYYTGHAFNDHPLACAYLPFARTNHRRRGDIIRVVISLSRPKSTPIAPEPPVRRPLVRELRSESTAPKRQRFGRKPDINYYAPTSRGR